MLPFLIRAAFIGLIFYTLSKLIRGLLRLGSSGRARGEGTRAGEGGGPDPQPSGFEFEEGQVLDVSIDEAPSASEGEDESRVGGDKDQH